MLILTILRTLLCTSQNKFLLPYGCLFFRLVPGAEVVKGLNTLSAWALQNGLLAGKQVRSGMLRDVSGINEEKAR